MSSSSLPKPCPDKEVHYFLSNTILISILLYVSVEHSWWSGRCRCPLSTSFLWFSYVAFWIQKQLCACSDWTWTQYVFDLFLTWNISHSWRDKPLSTNLTMEAKDSFFAISPSIARLIIRFSTHLYWLIRLFSPSSRTLSPPIRLLSSSMDSDANFRFSLTDPSGWRVFKTI